MENRTYNLQVDYEDIGGIIWICSLQKFHRIKLSINADFTISLSSMLCDFLIYLFAFYSTLILHSLPCLCSLIRLI